MQRAKLQVQNQMLTLSWVKPHFGKIKCNTDAAMFDNNSTMGYGICASGTIWDNFYWVNQVTYTYLPRP